MNVRAWASGLGAMVAGAALVGAGLWAAGVLGPADDRYVEIVWNAPTEPRGAPRPDAPHVVLVIGCTVRQDQTSIYGGPAETTPFLAEVASRGVRFADPITAAPWTRAASTALLTGFHPVTVGMVNEGPGRNERRLPDRLDTLAERFRAEGWATAGATLNPNLHAAYGFAQGFDGYLQPAALWKERSVKLPSIYAIEHMTRLLDGLPADRPVYLQVMFVDAHAPVSMIPEDRAAMPDDGAPDVVQDYRAGLRQLDRGVEVLRDVLERRGMTRENTLFVVTNDHGEGLGYPQHHGKAHGKYLVPSAVGGIWVMDGPGVAEGHVVDGVAAQVDIPETLLGMAGLRGLGGAGLDLSPQVRGQRSETGRPVAYSDTWFREVSRAAAYRSDLACQVDFDEQGSIRDGFATGCFDRAADPLHERPLDDAGMMFLVKRWRSEAVEAGRAFGAADDVVPGESLEAQLEALGYLDEEP